jgi:hypothetical protein
MLRLNSLVVGCAALIALGPAPAAKDVAKIPWKLTGQLEEACSCSAACPCWFGSKPTKMTCGGGQFLFITKGSYGSVKLDGLAVGSMSQSPEGKGMMESFGSWNFNYYYVDEKATPEQREALKAIANTVLAGGASPKTEYRFVPIVRKIDGKEHSISLAKYGTFSGHLIEGGLGGSSRIVNPPGADPLHHEYAQGESTKIAYNDAGQDWNFSGSNYMYGTFEIDSVQYEKHVAGLAQKQAAMKKN